MSSLFRPSSLSNCIGGSVDRRNSSFLSLKNKRLLVNLGMIPIYVSREGQRSANKDDQSRG